MRRPVTGLTLVEMVVALAIAAVLLAGTLTVTAHLPRSQGRLHQRSERSNVTEAVARLFDLDVLQADQVRLTPNSVELRTHATLSPAGEVRHVPGFVTYGLRSVSGRTWLYRRQQCADGKVSTALVCSGVMALAMPLPPTADSQPAEAAEGWRNLPDGPRINLTWSDGQVASLPMER
jgi:prepilin-type N-terminal cleavage/methylation domain-containing protein